MITEATETQGNDWYKEIVREARLVSDSISDSLAQQRISPVQAKRVLIGLADWYFRALDTENPFKIRLTEDGNTRVIDRTDLHPRDLEKIEGLKPLLAEPSAMVAQATLEHLIPSELGKRFQSDVSVGYDYDEIGYKDPKYFDITFA